ncbi:hypothetical protein U9M48_022538 [Paspalum notatum var. saurae]|uniref:Ceramide kinase n=1 Tax=Paspalum notatum var. saurae TaxID=547442 RepID=A0AAQ3TIR1_PASNO
MACIKNEGDRPKNLMVDMMHLFSLTTLSLQQTCYGYFFFSLLVFVHPLCGKGRGVRNWETVAPLFDRAKIKTKVITTERAGHAYDTLSSLSDIELKTFDGVVAVGGDGLFNEILNGILSSRYKASYPPTPEGFGYFGSNENCEEQIRNGLNCSRPTPDSVNGIFPGNSTKCDDHEPLLSTSQPTGLDIPSLNSSKEKSIGDQDHLVSFPNDWFRLGIIPSGSTDAIVLRARPWLELAPNLLRLIPKGAVKRCTGGMVSMDMGAPEARSRSSGAIELFKPIQLMAVTTGERDPVTSALFIILGRRMSLDIAQVVRWKSSPTDEVLPTVRYAASFAGYGFYGEVIRESENYRWMGPARYDFSGTMVFLKHRSYEAKVAFLETPDTHSLTASAEVDVTGEKTVRSHQKRPRKIICRTNCFICKEASTSRQNSEDEITDSSRTIQENQKWVWSQGRFLSVGAAVISCRNERAPDGLVADAHLSDGFLHLLLIRDCPLPLYLWHLTQFTKKGSDPLSFKFVEHHKTSAFTFISSHDESVWNLDGEIFRACEASVQACKGLVNLFASGPELTGTSIAY